MGPPTILVHTALRAEAAPVVRALDLKLRETQPYRLYSGEGVLLAVSGMGRENTRRVLSHLLEKENFDFAVNVGLAGCSDPAVPVGSFFCTHGKGGSFPRLPLRTFDSAVTHLSTNRATLVDMEADAFLAALSPLLPEEKLFVLKVVSDHLDDAIPAGDCVERLIGGALDWIPLILPSRSKLDTLRQSPAFLRMDSADRLALWRRAKRCRFTHQELRQLIDIALDLRQWDEKPLSELLEENPGGDKPFSRIRDAWEVLRNTEKDYAGFSPSPLRGNKALSQVVSDAPLGLGRCPVASERTRCCGLFTLDAVEGCALDCSYCSIRGFYHAERISFHRNIGQKLRALELHPDRVYHIGTGQSSDSLLWGNRHGLLDGLIDFAQTNPNVILELKTKSDNVNYLLTRTLPPNLLCTWSLNTSSVVHSEEHLTASVDARIRAARKMADHGALVGFHFHPIMEYRDSRREYEDLYQRVLGEFNPKEVVMLSFGTLTFTKPVIRALRMGGGRSKILQMPLVETAGKFSYPPDVKQRFFSHAYQVFQPWHDEVFFYLCMEDASLWQPVFGGEYPDNDGFESAMLKSYTEKIAANRSR